MPLNQSERVGWWEFWIGANTAPSGAELPLRRVRLKPNTTEDNEIVLRDLYPTKSDLYERARDLQAEP